ALHAGQYFEAERLSRDALEKAHQASDYDRMARITLPLQEARRQKRMQAVDTGRIYRINEMHEDDPVEAGAYLVEPMLVGANGRDLRDRADTLGVPVLVVVREPRTRLGFWPIVMIGPVTVRTTVDPPDDDELDMAWMLAAGEALGDAALEMVSGATAEDRVDSLMDLLGTIGDHEKLIQALAEMCREAEADVAAP
ncbi:MAG: hypothetical protein KDA21_03875, partial [Phycisphaerales bacterium]|nr:hypothetical protein [Phycisphaerales bacterium]